MTIKEIDLINDQKVREEFIDNVEVLERVKELILLPNTEFATQKQVANYYEVGEEAIKSLVSRNQEELKLDGYDTYGRKDVIDFLKIQDETLETLKGKTFVKVQGETLEIPNRGLRLFPRQAILRIGMMLQESKVATEVRNYLLQSEKILNQDQRDNIVSQIDDETAILIKVINSKDKLELASVMNEYKQFKDSQINKLEIENDVLADGIVRWDKRESVNRMIRKIAHKAFKDKGKFSFVNAWDKLKAEMLYKHHIHINKRLENLDKKNKTFFDVLSEDELTLAVQSCVSLCKMYKIDIDDLMIAV